MTRNKRLNDSLDDGGGTARAIESALATLQPLKDLSRNWDVNIATCLEDYLQELVGLATDEGIMNPTSNNDANASMETQEKTNFAHAALILQNSSHVYSRKVEYLYSLVYKALDDVFRQDGKNAATTNARRKQQDPDVDEFQSFDPNMDFLLLDDVLPHDENHRKINLVENDDDDDDENANDGGVMTPHLSMTRTRLSLGSVTGVERTYYTHRGGAIGSAVASSQYRALLGSLHKGNLRLESGQCDIGDDGTLLMPGSTQGKAGAVELSSLASRQRGRLSSLGGETDVYVTSRREFNATNEADVGDGVNVSFDHGGAPCYDDGDDHDHDDNDAGGFDFAGNQDDNIDENGNAVTNGTHAQHHPEIELAQHAHRSGTTKRCTFAEGDPVIIPPAAPPTKPDPFAILDPHVSDGGIHRPLKTGRTYRLPNGVDEAPSKCVTGASTRSKATIQKEATRQTKTPPSLIMQMIRALNDEESKAEFPDIKMDGLMYGDEFMYVAKAKAKERAMLKRQQNKDSYENNPGGIRGDDQNNQFDGNTLGNLANTPSDSPYAYDDGDDGGDAGDYDGFVLAGDYGGDQDDGHDSDDGGDGRDNMGMQSLDDAYGHQERGETNLGPKSFEQLCREHIEAFSKGAEEFALSTKLTDRVSRWQEKLTPILEEEEQSNAFDIHEYAATVVESVQNEIHSAKRNSHGSVQSSKEVVEFKSVARELSRRDVCRTFLATLSLANSGNLRIEGDEGDSFKFQLLSATLNQPMETYLAPSLADGL